MDERKCLGKHQRGGAALKRTPKNERVCVRCAAAQGGGDGETSHSGQEHPLAAIDIPESSPGNEADRVGQAVACDNEFDLTEARPERGSHCGDAYIGDKEIDRSQKWTDKNNGQTEPFSVVTAAGFSPLFFIYPLRATPRGCLD